MHLPPRGPLAHDAILASLVEDGSQAGAESATKTEVCHLLDAFLRMGPSSAQAMRCQNCIACFPEFSCRYYDILQVSWSKTDHENARKVRRGGAAPERSVCPCGSSCARVAREDGWNGTTTGAATILWVCLGSSSRARDASGLRARALLPRDHMKCQTPSTSWRRRDCSEAEAHPTQIKEQRGGTK